MRVGEPGRGVLDDSARPSRRVDGGKSRGGSEADWLEESQPPRLRPRLHPPTCEGGAGILTRAALSLGLSPADPETTVCPNNDHLHTARSACTAYPGGHFAFDSGQPVDHVCPHCPHHSGTRHSADAVT